MKWKITLLLAFITSLSSSYVLGQGRASFSLGHQTYNILESIDLENGHGTGYNLNIGYHRWISEEKATRIFFVHSSLSATIAPREMGSSQEIVAGSNYRYSYSGIEIQRKYLVNGEADDPNLWYYGWGFGVTAGTVTRSINYLTNGTPSTEVTVERFNDLYPMGFIGYEMPIQGRFIGFAEVTLSASIRDIVLFVPKIGVSYRLY